MLPHLPVYVIRFHSCIHFHSPPRGNLKIQRCQQRRRSDGLELDCALTRFYWASVLVIARTTEETRLDSPLGSPVCRAHPGL